MPRGRRSRLASVGVHPASHQPWPLFAVLRSSARNGAEGVCVALQLLQAQVLATWHFINGLNARNMHMD